MPLAAATPAATTFDASAAAWAGLGVLVVAMLLADLLLFGRGRDRVRMGAAVAWSIGWVALALVFAVGLWAWQGSDASSQYLAGYLLERALSLDNIFVFALIFGYFAVPAAVQPRVLAWGIGLALVFRLVFIVAGAALLDAFHVTFYAFGLLLVYTAWKLARHEASDIEPERNPALRVLRRRVPMTAGYRGHRLSVVEHGRRVATPMVAVLVVVATTDLVFAIDSIPAIFAVTTTPFIVFAANAFAMLGLRALYFVLAGMMDRFVYLSAGLSAILAYIGVKMLLIDVWHPPTWVSLAVIGGVLLATILLSLRAEPEPEAASAR